MRKLNAQELEDFKKDVENGFLDDPDVDVVNGLATKIGRPSENANKMHMDSVADIVRHFTPEEAQLAIQILVDDHWAYMIDILKEKMNRLNRYVGAIKSLSEDA